MYIRVVAQHFIFEREHPESTVVFRMNIDFCAISFLIDKTTQHRYRLRGMNTWKWCCALIKIERFVLCFYKTYFAFIASFYVFCAGGSLVFCSKASFSLSWKSFRSFSWLVRQPRLRRWLQWRPVAALLVRDVDLIFHILDRISVASPCCCVFILQHHFVCIFSFQYSSLSPTSVFFCCPQVF